MTLLRAVLELTETVAAEAEMSQFRNLVFEGGGVKGIAYAGAIAALEKRGILPDIRRVGGASAGAITACLLALGPDTARLHQIVTTTPYASFEDSGTFGFLSDLWRLVRRYGWYDGDAFAKWIRTQIAGLSGNPEMDFATLADWAEKAPEKYRRLYVIGTDLSAQHALIYSAETTPDVPLWKAVRISMSLPLLFASVKRGGDLWVDGGLTWNYPIDLFDRARYVPGAPGKPDAEVYNKATLGFRVDTRAEISAERQHFGLPRAKITNLVGYAKALVGFTVDMANHAHLTPKDWQRTVFIESHGIASTDFTLSDQQISTLIESGRLGVETWFEWFDSGKETPLNRVE